MRQLVFYLLFSLPVFAAYIGNIADPNLYHREGQTPWVSVRSSYLYSNIYKGRYADRFKTFDTVPTYIRMNIEEGFLTFNVFQWWDIYGGIGGAKMQQDEAIISPRRICYTAGTKLLFFKWKGFYLGGDAQYFYSKQKTTYYVVDGEVYPILNEFSLPYYEVQGALGIAFKVNENFVPYIGGTYFDSGIDPDPLRGILRTPHGIAVPYQAENAQTRKNWGMFLGTTLIATPYVSLTLEGRFFDQNAYNVSGTIRF